MLGVVLWSDVNDRKAVIWCEDQGDLAFHVSPIANDICTRPPFVDAGDMVEFDVEISGVMRRAKNVRLLEQKACAYLPDALLRDAGQGPGYGKVVPISTHRTQAPQLLDEVQKTGSR